MTNDIQGIRAVEAQRGVVLLFVLPALGNGPRPEGISEIEATEVSECRRRSADHESAKSGKAVRREFRKTPAEQSM